MGGRMLADARTELIREKNSNSGDRAPPAALAAPPQAAAPHVAVAAGAGARRKTGAELISGLPDSVHRARLAAPRRKGRLPAVAATIAIPALAVIAAVRFDPWAGEGCPIAVDRGADCARYGVAGRTYSEFALMNVDRELDNSQWASAKADLKQILLLRPNFAVALDARGEAEAALHDTAAALADFDRALTLAPDDLTTRAKRGQLYQSLGMTAQAAADFAFIHHADQSTPNWAVADAYVSKIDHSTAPTKVFKPSKRKKLRSADAGPTAGQSPQTQDAGPPLQQSPQTESSGQT